MPSHERMKFSFVKRDSCSILSAQKFKHTSSAFPATVRDFSSQRMELDIPAEISNPQS